MRKMVTVAALALAVAGTSACSGLSNMEQRTLSGGAIGAAGGAAIGVLAGGSLLTGALVGGAGGAAVGALTGDKGK